jgi:hypothetical protein
MISNSLHEERRNAIADLLYALFELPSKDESVRKRSEPLELGKREPTALGPVHGATHSEIAIHAPDCMGGFPGIKPDRVESVARDVLLRSADPDAVPMPVGFVFPSGLQQLLHLIRRSGTTGESVAACYRHVFRSRMEVQV